MSCLAFAPARQIPQNRYNELRKKENKSNG